MFIVTGATGQTGSIVAKTLLENGLPVRVVVRSAEKGAAWVNSGADVAIADLQDRAAFAESLKGGKVLYLINPPNYQAEDLFAETERTIESVRDAIEDSGLEKLIVLSSVGAHLDNGTGIVRTLHLLEKAIKTLAVPTVFLRPASFLENWNAVLEAVEHEGVLPSFHLPVDRKLPQISTVEIGRRAAEAMREDVEGVEVRELAGFEYSPADVAQAFAAALGKEVQAVPVPEEEWLGVLKNFCSESAAAAMVEMYRGINSGHFNFETENPIEGSVTVEEYARKTLSQKGE